MRSVVTYLIVLLLVCLAVFLDIRVLDHLDEMSVHMKLALRYRAVAIVESIESQILLSQASYEEHQAEAFEAIARRFFDQEELDESKSQQIKKEAQHYEQLANDEDVQVNATVMLIGRDGKLRAELLRNISLEQQRESDMVDELRQIHQGLCSSSVVSWLCDVVGGAVELQREADQESLQIQHDMASLEEVTRREFAEKLVAESLQGNASEYRKTSLDLFQTAQQWDSFAREEFAIGSQYNHSATELEEIGEKIEERGERDSQYKEKCFNLSDQEMETSVRLYRSALRSAAATMTLALLALLCVATTIIRQLLSFMRSVYDFASDERSTEHEFWRRVCAVMLHAVIFFVTAGLCGTYVSQIQNYGLRERAAIVSWFAAMASTFQTLIFQTIPHCMTEWPLNRMEVAVVVKYTCLRFIVLCSLFALEFLIVCTTFPSLISDRVTGILGNPATVFALLSALVAYLYCFEPRNHYDYQSMTTTLATDDVSSIAASEVTPLTNADEPYSKSDVGSRGSTTVALLNMDLGRAGRAASVTDTSQSQYLSMDSFSPYFVRLDVELKYLKFALDLFVVCCLVGVLIDCFSLVYGNNPTKLLVTLSFAFMIGIGAAAGCYLLGRSRANRHAVKVPDHPHIEIVQV